MRIGTIAAAALLLGGLAAGCGGDADDGSSDGGGAATDASLTDFCPAFQAAYDSTSGDDFTAVQDAWAELAEVGTPSDIDDAAREGFEVITDAVADSGSQEELNEKDNELQDEHGEEMDAFYSYAEGACSEEESEEPSDETSGMPSEGPDDESSFEPEVPSDLDDTDGAGIELG